MSWLCIQSLMFLIALCHWALLLSKTNGNTSTILLMRMASSFITMTPINIIPLPEIDIIPQLEINVLFNYLFIFYLKPICFRKLLRKFIFYLVRWYIFYKREKICTQESGFTCLRYLRQSNMVLASYPTVETNWNAETQFPKIMLLRNSVI